MPNRVVFISHPLRGARFSPQRRADMAAVRRILEGVHRRAKGKIVPIAPYLLYGECREDVDAARGQLIGWHLNPPRKLWLYGDSVSDVMRVEAAHAHRSGLRVVIKSPRITKADLDCPENRNYLIAAE